MNYDETFIIGVSGGTGSGKTTFVNKLLKELPLEKLTVISQDSYYKNNELLTFEERTKINFDHPDAIDFDLLNQHINSLKQGISIKQPVYSFKEHTRTKQTINLAPKKVIIVEGILIFTNPELLCNFDLKIFIESDSDERLIRRISRDITERGRNIDEVLKRYQNTLKPMHEQFIKPSKLYADFIIPNNQQNIVAVNMIRSLIKNKI